MFNGIRFCKSRQDGYYRAHVDKHIKYLHRVVWESVYGEIPPNFQIHHKDGNKDNNDISNLELVSIHDHLSKHGRETFINNKDNQLNHLAKIRNLATAWHKSEIGRNWHKEHGKHVWESMKDIEKICKYCGNVFLTKQNCINRSKFCSNACKSAYRRKSGIDNVLRICPICKNSFLVHKYSHRICCSSLCRRQFYNETKEDRV